MRHVGGVRSVINRIELMPLPTIRDLHRHIVAAMHRSADFDARHVHATLAAGRAVLSGRVSSWAQREAAEHAALSAPGIVSVENRIEVTPLEVPEASESEVRMAVGTIPRARMLIPSARTPVGVALWIRVVGYFESSTLCHTPLILTTIWPTGI